jgi:glutathione S-transferase
MARETNRKLYWSPGTVALASHIALGEAEVAYEAIIVDTSQGQQHRPDFVALNRKARVPVFVDGHFVLTETPAILRYIALCSPEAGLWPSDLESDARCSEWLSWCASTLHVAYANVGRPGRYLESDEAKAELIRVSRSTCRSLWQQVEDRFAALQTDWVVGERYTVADPYIFTCWLWGRSRLLEFDMARDFPHWTAHARRMGSRPATLAALERECIASP